jgi:hypothetical protein
VKFHLQTLLFDNLPLIVVHARAHDNGIKNTRVMELTMDDETRSTRAMEQKTLEIMKSVMD